MSLTDSEGILTILSAAGDGKIVLSTFDRNENLKKSEEKSFLPLYPLCVASSKIKCSSNILSVVATSDYNLRFFICSTNSSNDFAQRCEIKIGWVQQASKCSNLISSGKFIQSARRIEKLSTNRKMYRIHICEMKMKNSAGVECVMEFLGSKEGFNRVCSINSPI